MSDDVPEAYRGFVEWDDVIPRGNGEYTLRIGRLAFFWSDDWYDKESTIDAVWANIYTNIVWFTYR